MKPSITRQSYRTSLSQVQNYLVQDMGTYPAFMYPLVSLPRIPRKPLKDLRKPRVNAPHSPIAASTQAMAAGTLSSVELLKQVLATIHKQQPVLNAFVQVAPEEDLLAQAKKLDTERRRGKVRSALHGIPISVKDVIEVAGMLSTASSKVLEGNIASKDAVAVKRLKDAGAIIVGKTHTHEFALGVTTPQSRNPFDSTRDPGGSSGGSAISVATGMSLGSLGTDTRASIRVPSSLCGIVGYKPTYGLVPTPGMLTLSWSLDHTAHMGKTVHDAALMLNVLDPSPHDDYTSFAGKDVRGLKVAIPTQALVDCEPDVAKAFWTKVEAFKEAGVKITEIDQPTAEDFSLCAAMGLVISRCEAAEYHQPYRDKKSLYTQPIADQLDESLKVSAVDYLHAQRYRAAFLHRMFALMHDYDALLMPTTRVSAPKSADVEKFFMVLSLNCIPWSFIGFPAVNVPMGFTESGLPAGAELVTGPFEDGRLIALAAALEAV
jgi:aspartyl-tRNA(Asn)/glutamyl-tRNA(Gln) amidotransferase subunit A